MATQTKPKARNDAYTGLLAISFLALVGGCVLLYLDYEQYGDKAPTAVPKIDVPGANPGKPVPPTNINKKSAEPPADPMPVPKDGEAPKDPPAPKDGVVPKDGAVMPKDGASAAPAPAGRPADDPGPGRPGDARVADEGLGGRPGRAAAAGQAVRARVSRELRAIGI